MQQLHRQAPCGDSAMMELSASALNKENYTPWDSAESLTDDEVIIKYLKAALEENDPAFLVKATGNVARAKSLMVSRTTSSGA